MCVFYGFKQSAVESYEHGAWEYLPKPFDIDEAVKMIRRATLLPSQKLDSENESEIKAEIVVRVLFFASKIAGNSGRDCLSCRTHRLPSSNETCQSVEPWGRSRRDNVLQVGA